MAHMDFVLRFGQLNEYFLIEPEAGFAKCTETIIKGGKLW